MRRVLDDGVVRLREADEGDVPSLERGLRDPEVVRRFGRVDATAAEVLELNRGRWRDLSGPTFAITTPDLGFAGLVWINRRTDPPTDRGAVGYWLLPEARGRGLAVRAVALICDWAFADLRLAAVDLLTEADNAASRAVADRCGFRFTGERRPGTLFDGRTVEYLVHERAAVSIRPDAVRRPDDEA